MSGNFSAAFPEALFAGRAASFADVLQRIEGYADALARFIGGIPPAPRFEQDLFPPLDAAAGYTLVHAAPPRRLVEVGGGHSTRFFAAALRDAGAACAVTVIDPGARATRLVTGLPVTHRAELLSEAHLPLYAALEAGDIASLDGSHKATPGGDVDLFFGRILPSLRSGVRVHVHDIFLPDPYPAAWAGRRYDEQVAVAAALAGGRYRIDFASHYCATRLATACGGGVLGQVNGPGALASSLWITVL